MAESRAKRPYYTDTVDMKSYKINMIFWNLSHDSLEIQARLEKSLLTPLFWSYTSTGPFIVLIAETMSS